MSERSFCRAIGIWRSLIYYWKKNPLCKGRKSGYFKIGIEKVNEILKVISEYKEVASEYFVAVKCGVSTTTVGRVRRMYLASSIIHVPKRFHKHYEWLKRHACWSIDTMYIRFMGGWLYLTVVLEEYSRLILGWRLCEQKLSMYAKELVSEIITGVGIIPLIMKHDRGSEFMEENFQEELNLHKIISLPSPGHYAPFNSRMESSNRLFRKFTRPLESGYDTPLDKLHHAIERGEMIINEEFPRRMFDGKTSRQVYIHGEDYTEKEREFLIEEIYKRQERIEGLFFLRGAELDERRREVIDLLQGLNLCRVESVA